MDIEEYRKQFIDEIRFEAEHEGTDPESMFIEKTLALLEELGELNDPMPMSVELRNNKNQRMSFDAYAYDEADNALVLISSIFLMNVTPSRLWQRAKSMKSLDICKTLYRR